MIGVKLVNQEFSKDKGTICPPSEIHYSQYLKKNSNRKASFCEKIYTYILNMET